MNLHEIKKTVIDMERELKRLHCLYPYKLKILEANNYNKEAFFSWKENPKVRNCWRFYLEIEDKGKNLINKPFIETKDETIDFFSSYLESFINGYTQHLHEINERIYNGNRQGCR
jgi:hypothetical protein